jgi:hypothetical protein
MGYQLFALFYYRFSGIQTHWENSPSHSARTNLGKELTGLVGRAIYKGPWGEFLPYLQWGELLHVGKAVTFGMEKYRIFFDY